MIRCSDKGTQTFTARLIVTHSKMTGESDDSDDNASPLEFAQIVALPRERAGRILSWQTIAIGNFLTLVPIIVLPLGIVRALFAAENWQVPFNAQNWWNQNFWISGTLFVSGLVSAGLAFYWCIRNVTRIGNKYVRWMADSEFHSRADRIVSPDDQDAIFVEVVPRRNWGQLMLETATDVGYLLVDKSQRRVLFEGDRERYLIPGGAVVSCQTQSVYFGQNESCFTVIQALLESGEVWEAPVAFRGDFGMLGAATRAERARRVRLQIDAISDVHEPN